MEEQPLEDCLNPPLVTEGLTDCRVFAGNGIGSMNFRNPSGDTVSTF